MNIARWIQDSPTYFEEIADNDNINCLLILLFVFIVNPFSETKPYLDY